MLLGDTGDHHDLDFTTDARPADIKASLAGWADAIWTQGERFGTIGAKRGERSSRSRRTAPRSYHRRLAQARGRRTPTRSRPTSRRRDFTVNAMALALPRPGAGRPVRRRRRLPPSGCARRWRPRSRFSDDPLRMLRAARFVARSDLQPDAELVAAVVELRTGSRSSRAERIRDELDKLLLVEDPTRGAVVPRPRPAWPTSSCPSSPAMRLEQDPIHRHKDVLAHTIAVVRERPPTATPDRHRSSRLRWRAVPRRRQAEDTCRLPAGRA